MPEKLSLRNPQYLPKFSIKQEVVWAYVETHDHGTIIGYAWTNQTSCKALGYHYLIKLATTSASYSFCKQDWASEKDIELAQSSSRSVADRLTFELLEFNNRSIGGVA